MRQAQGPNVQNSALKRHDGIVDESNTFARPNWGRKQVRRRKVPMAMQHHVQQGVGLVVKLGFQERLVGKRRQVRRLVPTHGVRIDLI